MKAKLGQNFLADGAVLDFEAESADVCTRSTLEIGAGDGRLTRKLLSQGAKPLVAIELDPKLSKKLRISLHHRAKIITGDFLEFDESQKFDRIVGNIPYYITSPILLKLSRMSFGKALLCIQDEVAERMMAPPGSHNYGRLSVFCQLSFSMEYLAHVPKEAFLPMPKVDSAIVSLSLLSPPTHDEEKAIGAIFCHRKKSLRNAAIDSRSELFSTKDKRIAALLSQTLKYADRKVFTLSPSEALFSAREAIAARKG